MSTSIVSHNSSTTVVGPPFQPAVHSPKQHSSVYEIVTARILEQLERGVVPWRKPWTTESPVNLISQKEYRGINVFLLGSQGYGSRYWLTFNQAKKLGGYVKAGEKSTPVVFWHIGEEKTVRKPDGTDRKSTPILLRYYSVFNLCQTDGIAEKLGLDKQVTRVPSLEQCESIVSGMPNPPQREQSARAWYRPSNDTVGMPVGELFSSPAEYYSTLFHELTHSTGYASRVGRDGIENLNEFGSESYSKEELVAELGAAMLCGVAGIEQGTLANSAAYLQSWISKLRGDSRLLISAASAAEGSGLHPGQSGADAGRRGCGMTLRAAEHHTSGIRTFYVASDSNPGTEYAVQHIRKAGMNRWHCSCRQFFFRCAARCRHCNHIRFVRQGGTVAVSKAA